ncbi:MAG TPA: transposase [Candidatus Methanoperedens sp.]|nr:transposase [Candidatus Methanoperedens sp.]
MTVEIKTLIRQLELYEEQINSVEIKIEQSMNRINSKIMSIPGIGDTLGPIILGEIGNVDRFSSVKKLIAFAGIDPVVSQSGRFQSMSAKILRIVYWVLKNNKEYQTQLN